MTDPLILVRMSHLIKYGIEPVPLRVASEAPNLSKPDGSLSESTRAKVIALHVLGAGA